MIIALLALAFAMIVGGVFAAFFGWDIVLVERGWTMVIAGSVMAASGALLLGIAAAVSKLAKIETRLRQIQAGIDEEALPEAPKSAKDLSPAALSGGILAGQAVAGSDEDERTDETQPNLPIFKEEDRTEPAKEEVKPAEWPEEPRLSETVVPFPPRTTPPPAPLPEEDELGMKVPDFLLAGRERDTEEEPRVIDGADLYHREPDSHEPEPRDRGDRIVETEEVVVETVRDGEPEPDREPAASSDAEPEPEQEPEHEPEDEAAPDTSHPPVVVGTYNSGDNKYVMFSDGSIEAQTPSGVFHFESLDELKAFIAAGGEGNPSSST